MVSYSKDKNTCVLGAKMSKLTRKGRNPGRVDEWLEALGYYRKNIAYDETCLFRAVSEQLYACQIFHEKVRKDCVTYGRDHWEQFSQFMSSEDDWQNRMDRLEKHMVICGKLEIHMLSKAYNKGVIMFNGLNLTKKTLIENDFNDYLLLCLMGEDHYDVVYKKTYIEDAGMCQSIVYSALYENVFKISNVDQIVDAMLYQKPSIMHRDHEPSTKYKYAHTDDAQSAEIKRALGLDIKKEPMSDYEYMLKTNLAPFPFKVAKALDPAIYRNIEYDTWTETRKELRLGEWYYGDNNFVVGSGCILRSNAEELHCYIQTLLKHENKCVVYIASKGEKRTVSVNDLKPEPNAKPWPLPYRFSKHLVINPVKLELPDKKTLRKRREKKRTLSKCSNNSFEVANSSETVIADSSPICEAPVQLQQEEEIEIQPKEEPILQASCSGETEWSWPNADTLNWPPTPPPTQDMVTYNRSFAPRPEVYQQPPVSESGTYYQSQPECSRYSIWPYGEYVAPLPPSSQILSPSPHGTEVPVTPDCLNYFFSDGSSYSPGYYSTVDNASYQTTPHSPQVEVYPQPLLMPPPIFQQQMGTPVILATPEMLSPQPPVQHAVAVYSPAAIDVPYIPTSPYVFPPTPNQQWFRPPAINSQGFIFPVIPPAAGPVSNQ